MKGRHCPTLNPEQRAGIIEKLGALPGGWENWEGWQQNDFLVRWWWRQEDLARFRLELVKRAEGETFRPVAIAVAELDYEPDPGRPKWMMKASYGPACGAHVSTLFAHPNTEGMYTGNSAGRTAERLFLDNKENQLYKVDNVTDASNQGWGPSQFLAKMLQAAGKLGGDVEITMVHSGQVITFDVESFKAWAESSQKDPVTALMEPKKLLADWKAPLDSPDKGKKEDTP